MGAGVLFQFIARKEVALIVVAPQLTLPVANPKFAAGPHALAVMELMIEMNFAAAMQNAWMACVNFQKTKLKLSAPRSPRNSFVRSLSHVQRSTFGTCLSCGGRRGKTNEWDEMVCWCLVQAPAHCRFAVER
mmetsp:Transcript_4587/g.7957  ORF Transcript_4587/g.7957 Transcript_4587/m.7957 type:complete len:132 (-) Transcript_4587:157-552(-)